MAVSPVAREDGPVRELSTESLRVVYPLQFLSNSPSDFLLNDVKNLIIAIEVLKLEAFDVRRLTRGFLSILLIQLLL